jgi:hypothetical protein
MKNGDAVEKNSRLLAAVGSALERRLPELLEKRERDENFGSAVGAIVEKRFPNIARLDRFLSIPIAVVALLAGLGLLSLGAWAAKIVWEDTQNRQIAEALKKLGKEPDSPLGALSVKYERMSKTFESQVDSAAFKILRFGCTKPNTPKRQGFPECSADRAAEIQLADDQQILFVANPAQQIVRLDLSLLNIDAIDRLEGLSLRIYAEPPPILASKSIARGEILLKPAHVSSTNGTAILEQGRLRLAPPSGLLQASIDLTPSLKEKAWTGPIQLRFSAGIQKDNGRVDPATGTELFLIRSITSAYHSLPAVEVSSKK